MNEQEAHWSKYEGCWNLAREVKAANGEKVQSLAWLAGKYWEDYITGCERLNECSIYVQELVDGEAPIDSKVEGV